MDLPDPNAAAVKTYNYLRLAMLVAVAALGYSVLSEYRRPGVHCFLGSISGYYYTPVRPLFIGIMVTIGFTLIVIKGRTPWEDALLSLAGMMAPIVALIPTGDDPTGACRPQMLRIGHYEPASGASIVGAAISNNLHTLVYAGYTALALVVVARLLLTRRPRTGAGAGDDVLFWGFAAAALAMTVAGSALLHFQYGWVLRSHARAASAMFLFLGLAAIANCVLGLTRQHTTRTYAVIYGVVGGSMIGAGLLFTVFGSAHKSSLGGHLVLAIEAVEIFLFAVFWTVQTIERWNQTV